MVHSSTTHYVLIFSGKREVNQMDLPRNAVTKFIGQNGISAMRKKEGK